MMKTSVLFFSLLSAVLAEESIVGGADASIEDYPYQIGLLSDGSLICGGSIIGSQYIVTAGHCTYGASASSLSIRVGSSSSSSGGQVIQVSSITVHPDYNENTVDNDISILTLAEELVYGNGVAAIDLPTSTDLPAAGTSVVVTGWGALQEGGTVSPTLQYVEIPVIDKQECEQDYADFNSLTASMFCAGASGQDSCQGDSGGPLAADDILVGIVSWGNGCARPGYPGVYASTAYFRDFIEEVTGI
jgi:trypsin